MSAEVREVRFRGEVMDGGGGGHAVLVPADVAAQLTRKNARVRALVNGTDYQSRIARYGGKSYLGLRKDLLRAIAADTGDTVEIELTEEPEPAPTEPAEPAEPAELSAALAADAELRAAFDALPPSHRQEYLRWVAEAKRGDTRAARIARMRQRLSPGA